MCTQVRDLRRIMFDRLVDPGMAPEEVLKGSWHNDRMEALMYDLRHDYNVTYIPIWHHTS